MARMGPAKYPCIPSKRKLKLNKIRTGAAICYTCTSFVKKLTICQRSRQVKRLRQTVMVILIFVIRVKKRLASGTLLVPMQFPTMPQVAC